MLKTINSDGSLSITLIGSSVPAGAVYNSGFAYTPAGSLYVKFADLQLSGQTYNGGLACTPDGALYVTTDDPDSSSASRRGMLCRYDGAVHLSDAGLSSISYSGGIPTDSAGALYCNVPELVLNLTHTAIPVRGNITPNFTRATEKRIPGHEGILHTLIAGELGFPGARRVRNLLNSTSSENVTTWGKDAGTTVTLQGDGSYKVVLPATTFAALIPVNGASIPSTNTGLGSLYLKADASVSVYGAIGNGAGVVQKLFSVTTEWQRFATDARSASGITNLTFQLETAGRAANPNLGQTTIYVGGLDHGAQLEDITGRTDQTTPSEYVSVGVKSAPAYHGSMVDGVKCFPTDLDGNALTGMTTPLIELAGTQILATADIRDMTTAAWTLGATMTRARTSVGADGTANSATRLTGGAVAATNTCYNTITAAASSRTYSAYVKRVTGTGPVRIVQTGTETDISSQLTTTGYTRVQLNASVLNVAIGFKIDTNGDAIDVDFNQFEAGTAATSPMAATGAARAADQLYYTGADVANIKTLAAIGAKRDTGFSAAGTIVAVSDNTANETAYFGLTSATASTITGVDGGVAQWAMTPAAYSPGTQVNFWQSFSANDVKGSYEGTTQTADTSATMPTVSRIEYGMLAGASQFNGYPGKVYAWLSNGSQSQGNAVTA